MRAFKTSMGSLAYFSHSQIGSNAKGLKFNRGAPTFRSTASIRFMVITQLFYKIMTDKVPNDIKITSDRPQLLTPVQAHYRWIRFWKNFKEARVVSANLHYFRRACSLLMVICYVFTHQTRSR